MLKVISLNHKRMSALVTRSFVVAAVLISLTNVAKGQEGSIVGWGQSTYGQLNVPAPNENFTAIAAGEDHSLGLKVIGGACCVGMGCVSTHEVNCNTVGGTYQGNYSSCLEVSCPTPPTTGACCVGTSCIEDVSQANCISAGGTFQGDNSMCAKVICPAVCQEDLNSDENVDVADLLQLIGAWGTCLP